MKVSDIFSFPNPVNEYAARMVAFMVLSLGLIIIIANVRWLMIVLGYGFLARVATGPTLSPMGLLATKIIVPLFGNHMKPVPGPPKRFAQTIGLVISSIALVFEYFLLLPTAATLTLSVLIVFAAFEAILGFCAGCFIFGYLMRWGFIPQEVCDACNNLSLQQPESPISA
jgi:hypothetical protein